MQIILSPSPSSLLSSHRVELEVHSMGTIKLKLLTELMDQTNVIDGICQQCQELM